jgi:hypothetical protein
VSRIDFLSDTNLSLDSDNIEVEEDWSSRLDPDAAVIIEDKSNISDDYNRL